jgi:hypothetical protein
MKLAHMKLACTPTTKSTSDKSGERGVQSRKTQMAYHVLKRFTACQRNNLVQTGLGRIRSQTTISVDAHILYPFLKLQPGKNEIDPDELEKLLVVPRPKNIQVTVKLHVNQQELDPGVHKMMQQVFLEEGIQPKAWITTIGSGMDTNVELGDNFASLLLHQLNPSSFPPCCNLTQSSIFGQLHRVEICINLSTTSNKIQDVLLVEAQEWQHGNPLEPMSKSILSNLLVAAVKIREAFPLVFSTLVPLALPHVAQHITSIASSLHNILSRRRGFNMSECLVDFAPSVVGNPISEETAQTETDLHGRLLYGLFRSAEAHLIKVDQRRYEPRNVPVEWQTAHAHDQDIFEDEFEDLNHDCEQLDDFRRIDMDLFPESPGELLESPTETADFLDWSDEPDLLDWHESYVTSEMASQPATSQLIHEELDWERL